MKLKDIVSMLKLIIRFTKRIIKLPRAVARGRTVTIPTADQLPSSPSHLFLQQTMSLTWWLVGFRKWWITNTHTDVLTTIYLLKTQTQTTQKISSTRSVLISVLIL